MEAVVGQADVPNFSGLFGLQHTFIQTRTVPGLGAEGRVVELVEVDVSQVGEAGLQILPEHLHTLGFALGGNIDLLPHGAEGSRELCLAVRVHPGRVKKADSTLIGLSQQCHRRLLRNTLDGQRAKTVLRDRDPRGTQGNLQHVFRLLLSRYVDRMN